MNTAKKIVEKKSSGDEDFDNAIQKFFPKKNRDNQISNEKLKEIEKRFGVPFNGGKTKLKVVFSDEKKFIDSISKSLKSGLQEFEI